jgi:hypothetical protein
MSVHRPDNLGVILTNGWYDDIEGVLRYGLGFIHPKDIYTLKAFDIYSPLLAEAAEADS